jgi:hypothetical protein
MRFRQRLPLCLSLALCTHPFAWAQGLTGSIAGTITDPANAAVPNAKVTVTNVNTSAERRGTNDPSGAYRVLGLEPGEYTVTVEAASFRRLTTSAQTVDASTPLRLDLKLEIGPVTETVSVQTRAVQINTEDAQLGRVLRDIPQLPLLSGNSGRNPLFLVALQPGVAPQSNSIGAANSTNYLGLFSVNGQRSQANNYLLDGADSNDLAANIPDSLQQISPDALAEFRVITGPAKAEYGRNAGATVEVVSRSGGNAFHGDLSETLRNKVLNAVPFFQKVTPGPAGTFSNGLPRKPDWKSNDFDADLNGPIRKNQTFFLLSYLGFRRVQGVARSATVFTDQQRALIDQFGVPAAKAMLALVPPATSGNTLFVSPSNSLHRDQGLARVDHRFSDRNGFAATYFIEHQNAQDPFPGGGTPGVPGFGALTTQRFQNLILRDSHTFSAALFNDARASVHRRAAPALIPLNRQTPASLGFPGIVPDDASAAGPPNIRINGLTEFGNTIQGPQARYDTTWQYSDTLGWIKGAHAWKFGAEYRAYEQNQLFDFINNGYLLFDGAGTPRVVPQIPGLSASLNDFARGFVTDFQQANANRAGYRDKFFDAFVQDDWKVRRNVTLNVGVRWEYDAPLTELNDRIGAFRPGRQSTVFPDAPAGLVYPGDQGISRSTYKRDLNNFAPRFGFAWDPRGSGRWSIRGGYGLFFDTPVSELTLQFLGVAPYGIQPDETNVTDFTRPYETSLSPIPQPFPFHPVAPGEHFNFAEVAPIKLTVMDPDFATPYGQQFTLQVQRQMGQDWLADIGYVGSRGTKLLNRRQLNYALVTPDATTANTNPRRRFNIGNPLNAAFGGAVFSSVQDQLSDANSNYNALQASVTKRMGKGLSMTHAYTWSHAIDEGSGLRTQGNGNIYNRTFDRGNAEFDLRHRYAGSFLYELPFLKNQKGLLAALGGWGVSGVVSMQTGPPINIVEAADRCLCGIDNTAQHPDFLGGTIAFYDPRSVSASTGRPNSYFNGTGGGSASGAPNPYFRRVGTGNTAASGAGRLGTFGRDVFHGPGFANWDLRAFKRFKISERQRLEVSGDFFNAFNHAQFDAINSANMGNIGSPSFGVISGTRDPRIVQVNARYQF